MHDIAALESRLADLKFLIVGISRALRKGAMPGPGARSTILRSIAAAVAARGGQGNAVEIAERHYPDDPGVVEAMRDLPAFVARAVSSPASIGVPEWAGELATTQNAPGLFATVAPASIYARLSRRGMRLDLSGAGAMRIAGRADSADRSSPFIGESEPLPVRRFDLTASLLAVRKAALASLYSTELARHSTPAIEVVLRAYLGEDVAAGIDAVLVGKAPGNARQPAGLLYNVTPLTPGADLAADIAALIGAISPATDPVLLMNSVDFTTISLASPGIASLAVIVSDSVPPRTMIAVDAADFASAIGDDQEISISGDAVIVPDTLPGPVVSTPPTVSLWQQSLLAIRLLESVGWLLRSPDRVAFIERAAP